jgi:hypothetical protein
MFGALPRVSVGRRIRVISSGKVVSYGIDFVGRICLVGVAIVIDWGCVGWFSDLVNLNLFIRDSFSR